MNAFRHATAEVVIRHGHMACGLGAGAAGMFCAVEAARRGRSVAVLDHARAPGEKIRISGGGRCNFTNLSISASCLAAAALLLGSTKSNLAVSRYFRKSFGSHLGPLLLCQLWKSA